MTDRRAQDCCREYLLAFFRSKHHFALEHVDELVLMRVVVAK
jgi:hypothetical protein